MMRAGLAPLVGLSALAAAMVAGFGPGAAPRTASANTLPYLFHPVVSLLLSAAHEVSTAAPAPPEHSTPRAALSLEAMAATPLGGSLYLIAAVAAVDLLFRRHQRALLRC